MRFMAGVICTSQSAGDVKDMDQLFLSAMGTLIHHGSEVAVVAVVAVGRLTPLSFGTLRLPRRKYRNCREDQKRIKHD